MAAGFYTACAKLEQVQGDEIHPNCNKQDGFNLKHEQTGCLRMDQDNTLQAGFTSECVQSEQTECKVMHVQTAPSSRSGSVSLLQNMMTVNSADQHLPIASNSSLHANELACSSNVETMPTYQLSPSDASKEADDRLLLQSWYALPSENHNDHSIDGSVFDVKPVLYTLDTYTLHGNGEHGCIFSLGSSIAPSVVSPSVPPEASLPTEPAQEGYVPLPSSSSQSTQLQYLQQQQLKLVTTVKTPQCEAIADPVFDEKQDTDDQILEENKLLVLNELQLSLFGSKEVLLDFENGNLMPNVPHSSSDLTPAIPFASKTMENLLCTLQVQDLPMSVSIPSVVGSSVTAGSCKSTDAVGERACSVKKDVSTNQTIGLSSDVTESMDQRVAILSLNAPHVPMPLLSCDSKSNQSQGTSDSQRDGMSLSVSSKRTEFAVTSEINSNLAAESVESSDDDCVEIFIGRSKRKRNSHQSTHPSPKRVRDQGSSRGVVQPIGASTRVNAATKSVQVKTILKKRLKNAKTSEDDKTEYSLLEGNLASCMNLGPPDNDQFLYCGERKKEFDADFPVNGSYNYIQDKEVPEGDPLKADHTLPDCLEIKTSKIAGAGLGVFSKVALESRVIFGPYGGDIIIENHRSGYCWQIYKEGKASHFVDAQNKATSNWMRYVNCPMNEADKNLVAIQYEEGIYYCTWKPVSSGEELLIWYGNEFARELGLIRDDNLFSSKNNGQLKTHIRLYREERRYMCELCGYACNKSDKFKTHLRIHTGEKPFKCELCGYACNKSGTLKTHMRIHTGERPYKCGVCDYACKTSGNLKTHMRLHTEEKPHKCELCGYACNRYGSMKTHMRIHTGESPYKCELCDYACKHNSNLKRHMRIHTGETIQV
ncbi:PR domain zinc finger protein 4-like isoform X2 [Dreissena polymorpha]|nr:PR domain zinc finger protein 4-like isoform X2 [Dreissena polymorpha]